MGLLGTLVGGTLGFMVLGPLGAIIGGAIGSNIEGGAQGPRSGQGRPGTRTGYRPRAAARSAFNPLEAQQTFLVAMISLAAKVAKADGHVTPEEIRSFDGFLRNNLNMPAAERKIAARIFNEARDSAIPATEFARQLRDLFAMQPQRLRDLVTLLLMVALADGRLHPAEESLIREITREMGLSDLDYENALKTLRPEGSLDWAYAALGVLPDAEEARIKTAYRKLVREYHPDRLAGKGMSDDFRKFAAEKMRTINNAYDAIRKERGF